MWQPVDDQQPNIATLAATHNIAQPTPDPQLTTSNPSFGQSLTIPVTPYSFYGYAPQPTHVLPLTTGTFPFGQSPTIPAIPYGFRGYAPQTEYSRSEQTSFEYMSVPNDSVAFYNKFYSLHSSTSAQSSPVRSESVLDNPLSCLSRQPSPQASRSPSPLVDISTRQQPVQPIEGRRLSDTKQAYFPHSPRHNLGVATDTIKAPENDEKDSVKNNSKRTLEQKRRKQNKRRKRSRTRRKRGDASDDVVLVIESDDAEFPSTSSSEAVTEAMAYGAVDGEDVSSETNTAHLTSLDVAVAQVKQLCDVTLDYFSSLLTDANSDMLPNDFTNTNDELSKMLRQRIWDYTPSGRQLMASDECSHLNFTLASYNVLDQELMERHYDMYDYGRPHLLSWDYRRRNLIREIEALKPDILCMQEVNARHYNSFFKPELKKHGYDGVFLIRTGDKTDGCAVMFKTAKFDLERALPVEYYRPGLPLLDRDNVGLVLLLRTVKDARRKICVATTHLLFNPKRGDIRLAQLALLFAEIDKLAAIDQPSKPSWRINYHPVVFCGDFNLEPFSRLYSFIRRGSLKFHGLSAKCLSRQFAPDDYGPSMVSLLPPSVGVSDQCQFVGLFNARMAKYRNFCSRQLAKSQQSGKRRSSKSSSDTSESDSHDDEQRHCSLETDRMSHNLNLVSVYDHQYQNGKHLDREVTTCHNRSQCTVDYIFYSVKRTSTKYDRASHTLHTKFIKEGYLKLVGKLRLPTEYQMNRVGGLPNHLVSSDHVILMAKFALTL